MIYSCGRILNVKPVQYCFTLRAKLQTGRPPVDNITSLICPNYLQFCIRQGSENSPHRGIVKNVLLHFNRKSSSHTRASEQVLLYSYDNPKMLKVVNLFGLSFTAFWFFTSYQFATMRITPVEIRKNHNLPWFARFDLVSSTSKKLAATFIAAFIGFAVLGGAWMYSLRSVGKVVLGKGGKTATFTTFSPLTFSMSNTICADISKISCYGHRSINNVVPIKISGRWMHFLVSNEGTYHNGLLFDRTVGMRRSF